MKRIDGASRRIVGSYYSLIAKMRSPREDEKWKRNRTIEMKKGKK